MNGGGGGVSVGCLRINEALLLSKTIPSKGPIIKPSTTNGDESYCNNQHYSTKVRRARNVY